MPTRPWGEGGGPSWTVEAGTQGRSSPRAPTHLGGRGNGPGAALLAPQRPQRRVPRMEEEAPLASRWGWRGDRMNECGPSVVPGGLRVPGSAPPGPRVTGWSSPPGDPSFHVEASLCACLGVGAMLGSSRAELAGLSPGGNLFLINLKGK